MQLLVQDHVKAGNSHFGALTGTKRQLSNSVVKTYGCLEIGKFTQFLR